MMRCLFGTTILLVASCIGCGSGETASPATEAAAVAPFRETWEAHSLQGTKIGYVHTAYYRQSLDGRPVVLIESNGRLKFQRFGQSLEQTLRERTWETDAGEVVRFESHLLLGDAPQVTTGIVTGTTATLTLQTAGKTTTQTIAWPSSTGGSTAVGDSLLRAPMKPHAVRNFHAFLPVFNRVAAIELRSQTFETVDVDGASKHLLRIDVRSTIAGTPAIESVVWADSAGETWKTSFPTLGQTAVRTTESRAKATDGGRQIDLGTSTMVRVEPPLRDAHQTQQVRYRVRLDGGDAAATFPPSEGQTVQKLPDGAAEIVVSTVRPDSPLAPGFTSQPPTERDWKPSAVVQSDDETVRKLAAEAVGTEVDPWRVACRAEAFVHDRMRSVQFSQAFATAAETARTLTGDCTEHAVLLCALLRAREIPARVAIGLVYVEGLNAFGYHMWTEAYVGGRWIPLDATLGRGGTSAAYLKLTDSNLDGVDSYATLLPVFSILGRLKIDITDRR
jgi:transglutaminase-like putative cysteine protease